MLLERKMDRNLGINLLSVIVLMPTYNHEAFIAKAIESVLNQITDFDVYLCISDDASEDSTFEIASSFMNQNRVKISLTRNEYNLGAMMNGARLRKEAVVSGCKYVAILEGDDYWTNSNKLQKQIDLMENDDLISMSFHNASELRGDNESEMVHGYKTGFVKAADVINKKVRIPTLSMLFKSNIKLDYELILKLRSGDRYLEVAAASAGKIFYFDEVMGVKRTLHTGSLGQWKKDPLKAILEKYNSNIILLDNIVPNSLKKYMHRYLFKVSIQILKLTRFSELRFLPLAFKHFMLGL